VTCHDARERLSDLVDEALEAERRVEVEAHLAGCAECGSELKRLRATVAALRGLERPRAPVGFVDRVMDQVRPVPWYRRLGAWLFLPLAVKLPAGAAAAAAVAGLTLLVWERSPEFRNAARHELASAPAIAPMAPAPHASSPNPPADVGPPRSARPLARSRETLSSARPRSDVQASAESAVSGTPSATARESPPAAPAMPEARPAPPLPAAQPPAVTPRETTPVAPAPPPLSPMAPSSAGSRPVVSPAPQATSAPRGASEAKVDATTALPPDPKEELQVLKAPAARRLSAPGSPPVSVDQGALRSRANAESVRRILGTVSSPDAGGRLVVRDREAATAGVAELLSRLGGREIARRHDGEDTVIDVQLPAARYDEFVRGLDALGAWTPGNPPSVLSQDPPQVRLTIRLGG
jgi:hypothetical protein